MKASVLHLANQIYHPEVVSHHLIRVSNQRTKLSVVLIVISLYPLDNLIQLLAEYILETIQLSKASEVILSEAKFVVVCVLLVIEQGKI